MYCTNCGERNGDSDRFCSSCGTALELPAAAPSPSADAGTGTAAAARPRRRYQIAAAGIVLAAAAAMGVRQPADRLTVAFNTGRLLLSSQNGDAYYERALAYSNLGQRARAIQDLTAAIRLEADPRQKAALHSMRGSLQMMTEDVRRAFDDFTQAVALEPGYGLYHAELAEAHLRQGRRAEAEREAREAIRLGHTTDAVYEELFGTRTLPR